MEQTTAFDLISIRDAVRRTSLSRATLWGMVRDGEFPRLVTIGRRRKAFVASEVDAWLAERVAARDEGRS